MDGNQATPSERGLVDTAVKLGLLGAPLIDPIFQSEAAECGLASMAMAATLNGRATSLMELRQKFSVSLKGTTLTTLADIASNIGFHARAIRLEVGEVNKLSSGSILHWDLRHYVVLEKCRKSNVTVLDPARGRVSMSWNSFDKHFTGIALELTAKERFVDAEKVRRPRIVDVIGRQHRLGGPLGQVIILSILLQVFSVLAPILSQIVIDDAITRSDVDLLVVIGMAILGMQIVSTLISGIRSYVLLYIKTFMSLYTESNLLTHLIRQPVAWLEKRHIGDISSRFASLKPVQEAVVGVAPTILISSLSVIFATACMVIYSPLLSALEVGALATSLIVRYAAFPTVKRLTHEIAELSARLDSTFLETLRSLRTFKLFVAEDARVSVWRNERTSVMNAATRLEKFQIVGTMGLGAVTAVQSIVIWYIGAKLVISGSLTLGMLIAFKAYADQFSGASNTLAGGLFTFRGLEVPLSRLGDIVFSPSEPVRPTESAHRLTGTGIRIEFKSVSYRYAVHDPWILKDVSFTIEAGDFCVVVGPSGQGKSTLLKLILGFDNPTSGKILINGEEIAELGIQNVRRLIGAVLQEDSLLSGTVSDNIAFFAADTDMERVRAAALAANILDEVESLPMKFMTFVGDMGSTLSTGQRQRVLLARAFYKDPQLLVFDEGTSNLDAVNEDIIIRNIAAMRATRIAVAHGPAMKDYASLILEVRDGRVRRTN